MTITVNEGANEIYPLWDKLSVEIVNSEKIKAFREEKEQEGYEILSGNQLAKDGIVYWLIFDEELNCSLEPYGTIR